ncbi:MAG: nucleotide exchange factor GrpE [Thermomicrobiales bacterium]
MRGYSTHPDNDGMEMEDSAVAAEADLEAELLEQSLGIAELVAERDGYLEQLQRTTADYANYRRRTENERVQTRKNATRDLLIQLAPIADDFERALASIPPDQADSSLAQGVRLIERKLAAVLANQDVRKIDALGQPFDPAVHEAVTQDPDNTENVVVEVFQNGYTLGDQLLRPVMVRVGNLPRAN